MNSVLIVDDNRDVADSLALVLMTHGYDVRVAYDARLALAIVEERRPGAVMLDLNMPVVDGFELARHLRELHGPLLYLIAHSARDDEETSRRTSLAGFDRYVRKPATVFELISALGSPRENGAAGSCRSR